ncbi:MAG TPA: flagellar basal body rod protein FlgC [Anaerohalosphaeraceae bacterium]|jgi:flagellar basal-body rod protein FlgC|nr:flagellar basal body rod protein FlgC [Anaerohalosphaeraceae bacterium]HQG04648.1 flagellar basal body rod protein FlgC [Anaerohalosphaeraceae bacterium]HQI06522.1 flagellar basal body rod protein FlgC [Anaerohalosphaeraceae bacterium]HQJ68708.1 flagellar basal body rod protein FlgC [Anaerohalosphaeraceae bacterium]
MKIETINMFNPIDIATSGLRAYNKQVEVISSNLANIQTTDAGNGQPYRRLIAEFKTKDEDNLSGVELADLVQDKGPFQRVLMPGHPQADKDGYVMMPNISWPTEMVNLNLASRAYQANAAILKQYQKMVESSLELLK